MKKKFDMSEFNCWVQDTQDYSMITDKEVYITRKSYDAISYCKNVLGLHNLEAFRIGNNVHIEESKRLGL